jgi:BMFP domain-containing protein YqiC
MATKYIVNTKKMAFKFLNGKVLERKGVLAVEDKELEEMEKDYFFASLKEKGAISVSLVKPSEFSTTAEIIASDNAKIKDLEKEVAELKARLAEAEATGKETATVIDSDATTTVDAPADTEEENKTSKKGKK